MKDRTAVFIDSFAPLLKSQECFMIRLASEYARVYVIIEAESDGNLSYGIGYADKLNWIEQSSAASRVNLMQLPVSIKALDIHIWLQSVIDMIPDKLDDIFIDISNPKHKALMFSKEAWMMLGDKRIGLHIVSLKNMDVTSKRLLCELMHGDINLAHSFVTKATFEWFEAWRKKYMNKGRCNMKIKDVNDTDNITMVENDEDDEDKNMENELKRALIDCNNALGRVMCILRINDISVDEVISYIDEELSDEHKAVSFGLLKKAMVGCGN